MHVISLTPQSTAYNRMAADVLRKTFPNSYGTSAEEEISRCVQADRVALAMVDGETLLGFVGAIPQYGVTAWELHPLVVDEKYRARGVGTKLCAALEEVLRKKGCLTVYLGSDDVDGSTSLSHTDLFENTFEKIKNIQNFKRHPFSFYQKIGYQIVGVIPNANGMGKPDIWLAKSLV